jgi:microcystin-dependent protein
MYAFNFAPTGWAFCNGQLLPISQNTALFSLLGTTYGGDGKATFGLPNLQGLAVMSAGQSAGGSQYFEGETGGSQFVSLLTSEMPSHNHSFTASGAPGTTLASPTNMLAQAHQGGKQAQYTGNYLNTSGASVQMSPFGTSFAGGGQPHNNMQPYLTLNFCIAMQGIFPARP